MTTAMTMTTMLARYRASAWLLGGALALAAGGCDGDDDTVCAAGATQSCLGPGACEGAQICNAAGTAWGTCDCGSGGSGGSGSGGGGSGGGGSSGGGSGGGGGGTEPLCTEPADVPCSDQVFLGLDLQADIAPGLIQNTAEADGWRSHIDATAGGFAAPDPDSYVYGVFTSAGLTKVDLSDEDSLDSMDWDIGFRRYMIRINSGNSGPSCVRAAYIAGTSYDALTAVPPGLEGLLRVDEYFNASCELIPDSSGLGSPDTALSGFWVYTVCVSMTGNVYVLELRSGRHLKLEVTNYYNDAAQAQCQSGTAPPQPNDSANIRMRWAFLP